MRDFNVIIEKGRDGYLISEVLELPGCHTQAKSLDELMKRTKEAIELYLEVERLDVSDQVSFVGIQKLTI